MGAKSFRGLGNSSLSLSHSLTVFPLPLFLANKIQARMLVLLHAGTRKISAKKSHPDQPKHPCFLDRWIPSGAFVFSRFSSQSGSRRKCNSTRTLEILLAPIGVAPLDQGRKAGYLLAAGHKQKKNLRNLSANLGARSEHTQPEFACSPSIDFWQAAREDHAVRCCAVLCFAARRRCGCTLYYVSFGMDPGWLVGLGLVLVATAVRNPFDLRPDPDLWEGF
jgi:hypothetical protein